MVGTERACKDAKYIQLHKHLWLVRCINQKMKMCNATNLKRIDIAKDCDLLAIAIVIMKPRAMSTCQQPESLHHCPL